MSCDLIHHIPVSISHIDPISSTTTDSTPYISPTSSATMNSTTPDSDAPTLPVIHNLEIQPSEPLYTEIHIPLPHLPSPSPPHTASQSTHSRARSLSTFSPFRPRSSSSPPKPSSSSPLEPQRIRPSILKSRQVASAMNLAHPSKRGRSCTIDALAVVPAVLVLSAELFTPGTKDRGRGGMEGGMM